GDIAAAKQIVAEEKDAETREYAESELSELEEQRAVLAEELEELVSAGDSVTRGGVIMEIRAGTGGDEAAIFAGDLFSMYSHYIESKGWKIELMESSPTERGGFKEITFSVTGQGAF